MSDVTLSLLSSLETETTASCTKSQNRCTGPSARTHTNAHKYESLETPESWCLASACVSDAFSKHRDSWAFREQLNCWLNC